MPLSFRRSFKRRPTKNLSQKKSRLPKPEDTKTIRPSKQFRASKYPPVIPIGCGAAISLCIFVAFSRGLVRLPLIPRAKPVDYSGLATSAFETALAGQIRTLATQQPPGTATPLPTASATPAATATLIPVMAPPSNPWAANIPEAACIPADLPQTGRVVEVVDGNTIKVLMDGDGRVYSVRYLGADVPVVSSGAGLAAMAGNIELAYRRQAVMVRDITDTDVNGTLLRYVMVDRVFVNHALVSSGLATTNLNTPDTACQAALLAAERQAQAGGLGIWGAGLGATALAPAAP